MRKLIPLVVAAGLAFGAPAADAQTLVEISGDIGYTSVDVNRWLSAGVFDPVPLEYGGSALVLFGRRGAQGLHVGIEAGYGRVLGYKFIVQGQDFEDTVDAARLLVVTRFWFDEGAWFGEAVAGVVSFSGASSGTERDPALGVGAGKLFDLSERFSLLTKARGAVAFDSGGTIFTVHATAGLSYNFPR